MGFKNINMPEITPDPKEKTKVLYDAISKEYEVGSYDDFFNKLQDSTKRKTLYDAIGNDYDLGTFDDFSNKVVSKKKVTPLQPSPSSAIPSLSQTIEKGYDLKSQFEPQQVEQKRNLFAEYENVLGKRASLYKAESNAQQNLQTGGLGSMPSMVSSTYENLENQLKTIPGEREKYDAEAKKLGDILIPSIKTGIKNLEGKFTTKNGELDYSAIGKAANMFSQQIGGGDFVKEQVRQQLINQEEYYKVKPSVNLFANQVWKKMTGKTVDEFVGEKNQAVKDFILQKQVLEQNFQKTQVTLNKEYTAKSEQINEKYKAILSQAKSEEEQSQIASSYITEMNGLASQYNSRINRVKKEVDDELKSKISKAELSDETKRQLDIVYNEAYKYVTKANLDKKQAEQDELYGKNWYNQLLPYNPYTNWEKAKKTFFAPKFMALGWKSATGAMFNGISNLGNGLVGLGLGGGFTDFLRGQQQRADRLESVDVELKGMNWLKPNTFATRLGKQLGFQAPIIAATAFTKNPFMAGTIGFGVEQVQNAGEVYNTMMQQYDDPIKAQNAAKNYLTKNLPTLPLYFLESEMILRFAKAKPGVLKNVAAENLNEVTQELFQGYTQQQEYKNAKSLGTFLKEDAPNIALETALTTTLQSGLFSVGGKLMKKLGTDVEYAQKAHLYDLVSTKGLNAAFGVLELKANNNLISPEEMMAQKEKLTKLNNDIFTLKDNGLTDVQVGVYLSLTAKVDAIKEKQAKSTNPQITQSYQKEIESIEKKIQEAVMGKLDGVSVTLPSGSTITLEGKGEDILSEIEDEIATGQADITSTDEKVNQQVQELKQKSPPLVPDEALEQVQNEVGEIEDNFQQKGYSIDFVNDSVVISDLDGNIIGIEDIPADLQQQAVRYEDLAIPKVEEEQAPTEADIENRLKQNDKNLEALDKRQKQELAELNKRENKNYTDAFDILNVNQYSPDQSPRSKEAIELANRHQQEFEALNNERKQIQADADNLTFSDYDFSNKKGILDKLKNAIRDVFNKDKQALDSGFEVANQSLDAALEVGADQYVAHGMGKTNLANAFNDLITLFTKGINPSKGRGSLDIAPLAGGVSTGTTSSGNAYMDGAFTLVANREHQGAITNINQIGGIIVNEGMASKEVLNALRELFPNLVIESTSNTKSLVEQLNKKSKPKTEVKEELKVEEESFTAKGGNKVVDENGEPITLLHGTNNDKIKFDEGTIFYATDDKQFAGVYGENLLPVKISLKNPYDLTNSADGIIKDKNGDPMLDEKGVPYSINYIDKKVVTDLKNRGFDGVRMGNESVVAFDKSQVKPIEQPKVEVKAEPKPTTLTNEEKVKQLRAEEQAEYDAVDRSLRLNNLPNRLGLEKRQEIYNKYDKLITPLLEKETPKAETKEQPKQPKKEKTFVGNGLERAEAKRLHQMVKNMPAPTSDADEIALRYIADGGTIGEEAINEVAGRIKRARLNTGERELKTNEAKARDYYRKEGETLDDLAHRLWEKSGQEVSEIDIKDALMTAIRDNNTRLEASKAYLEKYSPEYAQEKYYERIAEEKEAEYKAEQERIAKLFEQEAEEEILGLASQEHINNLINQYEAEFNRENQEPKPTSEAEVNKPISGRTSGEENEIKQSAGEKEVKSTISKSSFDALIKRITKAFPKVKFFYDEVTFNEKMKKYGNGNLMRTPSGTIYGATFPDGSVYINQKVLSAETPIHEASHIWEALFPKEWKNGIELFRQSKGFKKALQEVQSNKAYKNKTLQEQESEALNTLIGRKGEGYFQNELLSKFKAWLQKFFNYIGGKFGIKLSPDTKLNEFVNDVIGDILGGKPLTQEVVPAKGMMKINGENVNVKQVDVDVVNGFYSPLEKIISESKFDKLPAKQWLEKFAKGEEAKWTGLNEWLSQQQGSVSKSDIQQFLKDNRISVVEVVKKETSEVKHAQYQLEGEKENYKEVLVTMPTKDGNKPKDNATFKSYHFDEPNILVHLRMNTRKDIQGNKVLFLEEVQSDWGQKGKKEGFIDDSKTKIYDKIANEYNVPKDRGQWSANVLENAGVPKELVEIWHKDRIRENNVNLPSAPFVTDTNAWTKLGLKVALKEAIAQGATKITWTTGEQQNERYDLSKQVDRIEIVKRPNVDSYRAKVYKNGTILADTDYIAFNELEGMFGKEIAKKVESGETVFEGDGLKVGGKGMKGFYGSPSENKLGIVGEVAKSLFKQEPKTTTILLDEKTKTTYRVINNINNSIVAEFNTGTEAQKYKNENEEIAGEFRISSVTNDVGKGIATQHSIDITPELRAQVEKGQPLFMAKGNESIFEDYDKYNALKMAEKIKNPQIVEQLKSKYGQELNKVKDITLNFDKYTTQLLNSGYIKDKIC